MESTPKPVKEGISSSLSIDTLDDIARAAKMIYQSGAFGGLANSQEAGAKIMAGLELGLSPMTAVRNIYFFDGQVTLSGPIIAALIRKHPNYDYRILGSNTEGAKVRFFRREQVDGEPKMVPQKPDVAFTKAMAERAGLLSKQNWRDYPEDMYVWRCVSRGARWHCPEVGKGTLYLPDEIKHGATGHEPAEQIESEDDAPDTPEVEGEAKQVPKTTGAEDVPSFDGAPGEEQPSEDATGEEAPDKQVKPLDGEGTTSGEARAEEAGGPGGKRAPAKPYAEATAPANTEGKAPDGQNTKKSGNGGKSGDSSPSGQMEDPAKRREAMVPSYVTVNPGALTKEATQKAKAIQSKLRSMDPGNALLTQIKQFREEVRDAFPNEEDADRKALDQILNHHISRIGGGGSSPPDGGKAATEPEDPGGKTAEDSGKTGESAPNHPENTPESPGNHPKNGEPVADGVEVPPMPWFETIGAKFRADMEKTRHLLQEAAGKKGIPPLEGQLDRVESKFKQANPTPEMENAFEGAIAPYRAILKMRKALLDGDPSEEAFNEATKDHFNRTETYSNQNRRVMDREIVQREAKRLAREFDSVELEFGEDGPVARISVDTKGAETPVPDMPLPPGFPKRETLLDANVGRTGDVAKRLRDGVLTEVSGIGDAFRDKIADYLREITDGGSTESLGF